MSGFLSAPGPRWFSIPAHRPFLADLAAGLIAATAGGGPEALADATVLLPNRRAVRGLGRAFLAASGGRAILPPLMRPLGDLDEDEPPFEPGDLAPDLPPAITAERRRYELAGLAAANAHRLAYGELDAAHALALADALAGLIDALGIEEVLWPAASADLVPVELAEHWRVTSDFLDAVLAAWPARLAELGMIDRAARRVAVTRRWIDRWTGSPPAGIVVAAGSTGSSPATADLLAAIAAAPRGCVVLPGLDRSLAEAAWLQVDDQHPQGAMSRLLLRAGVARGAVRTWDPAAEAEMAGRWRRRLINEALRPPAATADWLEVIAALRAEAPKGADPIALGLEGLSQVEARAEEETAAVAALLLREALETPGRTAQLVTPDPELARRVQSRLSRWGVSADSSAGESLAAAPSAVLAGHVARLAADPLDPVGLLATLKHPLTRLGLEPPALAEASDTLERWALRGEPLFAFGDLEARIWAAAGERHGPPAPQAEAAGDLARRLGAALGPLAELPGLAPAEAFARAVARTLEALTAGPEGGPGDLWGGQAGEALAGLFASLLGETEALPPLTAAGFAELFEGLAARSPLRPGGASHPRLAILGVLEARLADADLTLLAGLEEGVWPAPAGGDPFLSRPMRTALGLPPAERRIGLAAHDFAQAAASREVVLLHTQTRGGAPTVVSRWLWRLRALTEGAGCPIPGRVAALDWARRLDAPLADPPASLRSARRPAPTPPVALRPRQLSVTQIETWRRDPYAIYARRVLGLEALERPGAAVDARRRGSAIHAAFEAFTQTWPDALPDDAETRFEALLVTELRNAGVPPGALVREQARAANTARWAMAFERRRRPGARLHVEQGGRMQFAARGGPFTLTARADRIEVRGAEADILDFKTGAAPTQKEVKAFFNPQLTLTGAILSAGGFAELGRLAPRQLLYVRVSGGRIPGREENRDGGDAPAAAEQAMAELKALVDAYDAPETPYLSWTAPQYLGRYGGDYDHLARVWEWWVIGEAEEDEP